MSYSPAIINLRRSLRSKKERLVWSTFLLVPSVCDPLSAIWYIHEMNYLQICRVQMSLLKIGSMTVVL
jgi:hypothetical protein